MMYTRQVPTWISSPLFMCRCPGPQLDRQEHTTRQPDSSLPTPPLQISNLEEQLEQFREELENKSEEVQQLHMQLEIQRKELSTQQQDLETKDSLLQVTGQHTARVACKLSKKRNILSLSTAFIFSKLNMCKYLYEHNKIQQLRRKLNKFHRHVTNGNGIMCP